MAYDAPTRSLQTQFKSMSLKKIKRSDIKVSPTTSAVIAADGGQGDQSVTEEKFALCFTSTFSVGGEFVCLSAEMFGSHAGQAYTVRRLSLPLVVIVHGTQQCDAEATILWDCSFADIDRVCWRFSPCIRLKKRQMPFAVPSTVSLGQARMP